MASKDTKKMILKYGKCTAYDAKGRTTAATALCAGCGKEIKSEEDLTNVHFSLTKRKSCVFWHEKCGKNVWSSLIYVERK